MRKKIEKKQTGAEEKGVVIPRIEIGKFVVKIVGDSPLLCHRFGEKTRRELEEKYTGAAKQPKEHGDPQADYLDSLYPMPGKNGAYGFPGSGIKGCAVSASRFLAKDITLPLCKGAFHVIGELLEIDGKPEKHASNVRIKGTSSVVRYRGIFKKWSIMVPIRYNKSVFTIEQVVNLINVGGFSVGIGDWRPERNGSFGMFHVEGTAKEGK